MRKKDAHHGGAWKVAYADFVTAMMALFLVLWLAAQDTKIKEAVERAFRNPFMSLTKESAGLMPSQHKDTSRGGSGQAETGAASPNEVAMLRRLQQDLAKALSKPPEEQDQEDETVKYNLTPEGLRISIFDRARKPVFEEDNDKLTPYGQWILSTLAWEVSRFRSFTIELEGHTERGRRPRSAEYSSWELTADRANSGRRKLLEHGVELTQIKRVAGLADTVPVPDAKPEDPINRRLTLLLRVKSEKKNPST
jgi:chemotaxis protein MotB